MNGAEQPVNPAAEAYAAWVREALSDLPAHEVAEIDEDVREHLAQVVGEFDGDVTVEALITRLGTPVDYAADLRTAAGIAEPGPILPPPARTRFGRRLMRFVAAALAVGAVGFVGLAVLVALFWSWYSASEVAMVGAVLGIGSAAVLFLLLLTADDPRAELAALPGAARAERGLAWVRAQRWGAPALEFAASLRPAWWVLRALVLAGLAALIVNGAMAFPAVVFVAALVGSVWLGRRAAAGEFRGRRLLAVQAANAGLAMGAVLAVAVVFGTLWSGPGVDYVNGDGSYVPPEPGLYNQDGELVTNVFPYGPDGQLLENVRLYDQNGLPLTLGESEACYSGAYPEQTFTQVNPWGENVFPRGTVTVDDGGLCKEPQVMAPFGGSLPGPATSAEPGAPGTSGVQPTEAPATPGPEGPVGMSPTTPAPTTPAPTMPAPTMPAPTMPATLAPPTQLAPEAPALR
ncbi:MAG TPA: hypothetical protein VIP77_23555 [Jiangellaceae bacterium]